MTVERLYSGDLPDGLADYLNDHSFLTSTGFLDLWSSLGGRAVYWGLRDGNDWQVVLPGVEYGRGLTRRIQFLSDGFYAQVVSPSGSAVTSKGLLRLLEGIRSGGYCRTHVYDFDSVFPEADEFEVRECRTALVDVSAPDWEPPDAKLRSEIRKAEREGITVEAFDPARHFEGFVSLWEGTAQRQGREPSFGRAFYELVAELSTTDDRLRWKYVAHEGRPAASHIYIRLPGVLFHWQVFFDKSFSFLKPNQYLLYSAAQEAAKSGLKVLNLGATPPDAESLAAYKDKWGGRAYSYRCLERRTWVGRLR